MEHNIDTNNSQYQMNLNTSYYPHQFLNQQSKGVKCLYKKYKKNFSSYLLKHKHTLRLLKDNSTLQNIKAVEYINESKHKDQKELTPLPYKSFRKYKNEKDKRELQCLERNAVMMRRIEYTYQMKVNELKRKYGNKVCCIVFIQKMIRGFIIRNIMTEIYFIKQQIEMFIVHIKLYCIINRKRKRKCLHQQQNKVNSKFKTDNYINNTQCYQQEVNTNKKSHPDTQGINDIKYSGNAKLKENHINNNSECIKHKRSYGHKYCDSGSNTFIKEISSINRSSSRFRQQCSSLCTKNSTNLIKNEGSSFIKLYQKHSPMKTTSNTNRYIQYSKQLNYNKFLSQNNTSRYNNSKDKFHQCKHSHRNKIYNLSLNSLSPSTGKQNCNSKYIPRDYTSNPKIKQNNLTQQDSLEPPSKRQLPSNLKTFDIKEISTNGLQLDSQNMLLSNDNLIFEICPDTLEDNIETIQEDFALTEQRANKLFPLFNSVTEDIQLLNRVNKVPINANKQCKANDDIIENDSEVFN